ncbi:UDP-N-acetyl-D-mannosamine dehydrogenase [Dietzia sp. UCD-THP]|uniref:UDP-N-acetyl-D-mannosamine dehydrogenase n=1 Tax=Dietzia sp. UCD-THP TaxID=1292020 RepID=UPI0009DB0450|nr:UDP-N-acetyl-D-mannosamine dehydrogenase [Dietzia sp. UCD-THP]
MKFEGTVAVVGLGYIGLPTSVVLASDNVRVVGVDTNELVVRKVNEGVAPIVEPGLGELLATKVENGNLTATTETPVADAYLIAVPTPITDDNQPDVSYLLSAVGSIAPRLRPGALVIIESTCPPGTTHMVEKAMASLRPDLVFPTHDGVTEVFVAHCPERVLPGRVLEELVSNDRVIGGLSDACSDKASAVYETFCKGLLLRTDATSAEMAKLAENSFRDVNIAFANELANISEALGVDPWEVIRLANRHPRVNILDPGPGVGGHCIAVDPWFLAAAAPKEAMLIPAARTVNNGRPEKIVRKIRQAALDLNLGRVPVVACLGLSFKPNIDDLRESPAVEVVRELSTLGEFDVLAAEPHVRELPQVLSDTHVRLVGYEEAVISSDVLVLLVDHAAFASLRTSAEVRQKIRIDTRGFWKN